MGGDASVECSSSNSSSTGDGTQCDQNHQVPYKPQRALVAGGCALVSTSSNRTSSDSSTHSSRRRQAYTAATPSAPLHQQAPGLLLQAIHWQQPWAQQCHPHMMQACCWTPPARSHAGISIHSRQQPLRCLHTQQQQQPHKQQQQEVLPGGSWTSPPNLLSLSRVAASPLLVWLVLTEAWAPAVALVTAAGVSEQGKQPIHAPVPPKPVTCGTHGWAGKLKVASMATHHSNDVHCSSMQQHPQLE